MVLDLKEVLQQVGWSDGCHIPVVNEENLKLEAEVERLLSVKATANARLEHLTSRCAALEQYKKSVVIEQQSCQSLLTARHSQLETEKHLYTLAKMEKERLNQDARRSSGRLEKLDESRQAKIAELERLVSKTTAVKETIEWDEDMIGKWEEMLTKKEQDNEIIKRFSKEDEKKVKELQLKRQRLTEEEHSRRNLTIRMADELVNMELILARVVQTFRQMNAERSSLLHRWMESVKHLQTRDQETKEINAEVANIKEVIEAKQECLAEQQHFYANELNNNKELEMAIETSNKEVSQLRKEFAKSLEMVQDYSLELENMRRELRRVAGSLQNERCRLRKLEKDCDNSRTRIEDLVAKNNELKVQAESAVSGSMSATDRAKRLEELIATEELLNDGLLKDVERMQGSLHRTQTVHCNLADTNKRKAAEIRAADSSLALRIRQIQQITSQIQDDRETVYKLDFRINVMENKLGHLMGDISEDLLDVCLTKIKELERTATSVAQTYTQLQNQIDKLGDEMSKLNNTITVDNAKLNSLNFKVRDHMMMVEGATRQLQQCKSESNQSQVQENLLKVRIKHAQNVMKSESNTIYTMQKQLLELETMMNERRVEIEMNRELLKTKKRTLDEEKHHLKFDIVHRQAKIEQLKKRHDSILSTMGKSEDGEALSITYFKIKNAQEKYMLQTEGDELDSQIQKAEKEIVAMENTLKIVNVTNEKYKSSLAIVEDEDDELVEMKALESVLHKQTKVVRQAANQLNAEREKLQQTHKALQEAAEGKAPVQEEIKEKERQYADLRAESERRKQKLQRAYKQIQKLKSKRPIEKSKEKDLTLRHLKDSNRSALQQLSEACVRHMDTGPVINRYLAERNISVQGSSSTSVRSRSTLSQQSSCSTASIPSINLGLNIPR